MDEEPAGRSSAWRKLLWFIGLWAAGAGVVLAVAYAIRLVLVP